MKVALVHDYIKEYGGAERVLKTLTEMFPRAPIYTAFKVSGSTAAKEFTKTKIIESWLAPLIKIGKLYSPLRFLAPLIWGSFDLSKYDLVITSASWYITRGFKVGPKTKVVCYCHTPPRFLYGYETSIEWQKYLPVRLYALIVNHFLRIYDFKSAQKIKYWVANSKEVWVRIKKIYHKEASVIYPPVKVEKIIQVTQKMPKKDYYLIVSRLVGAKGIGEAIQAANKVGFKLKIVGEAAGFSSLIKKLEKNRSLNVELLGRVSDEEIYRLYGGAKGFIALAKQEDFGITVVEAMAAGTPVLAFRGGGFKETVIEGKTGIFIDQVDNKIIAEGIKKLESISWNKTEIQKQALEFSENKFISNLKNYLKKITLYQ